MWNDTDTPLAYFISFRGHGTWLHGDERGSTDRRNNVYGTPHIPPDKTWQNHNRRELIGEPVKLNAARRQSVKAAIGETCTKRNWSLLAINVRTNHVHVVCATSGKNGELALNAFKANATRQMRQDGVWASNRSPWADKGSVRRLWNERSVANAIDYVLYGQGDDLPNFDHGPRY
jgi:REP element-mobilizing transposase RayT